MEEIRARTAFEWTADYAVGVPQIDDEHQQLFALVEKMHQAMIEGKGREFLEDLLMCLVSYTCYHFAHEEQLMERIAYPGYREHRRQHEDLRSRLRPMQDRADSGQETMTIEVMLFLMEWLKTHVTTSDRLIGTFIMTNGISLVP